MDPKYENRNARPQLFWRDGCAIPFTWFPVGTVLERDGKKYSVLYAGDRLGHQCSDCALSSLSANECLLARRCFFGDCVRMSRGDATRVIFHEIGSKILDRTCRKNNVIAGLDYLF